MSEPQPIGSILDRMPAEQRTCEQHGDYLARSFGKVWSKCPGCREAEREREQHAFRNTIEEDRIREWTAEAGIPRRFRECSVENYAALQEAQQRAKDFALAFAADLSERTTQGRSAVFCGRPGTGKTHLACALAHAAIRVRQRAMFTTTVRLVRRIKETWSKGSEESESQAIRAFTAPDLLVLDEVGVQFGSETEKLLLFDVLNERYEAQRSTIIISNLDLDGVKAFLGERVFDRMREDGGQYIAFTWESYRGQEA